jgi:2-polyprenyl-3-methyl-5-hydroxy-6-metoxy-1,4-benzoquinol methylase
MAERIDRRLTRRYLDRRVDGRMVALIDRELRGAVSVLDVGCGSGLYGPALRRHASTVVGVDHDPVLCRQAEATGAYDQVLCAPVARLAGHLDRFEVVFCSEFVEHLPNRELRPTLDVLESVAAAKVVITVPNRLFPHAHLDPTHVLRYRLRWLLGQLNHSRRFAYTLHPLGLAEHWRRRPWCRPLDALARRVASCSPTVLFVGTRVARPSGAGPPGTGAGG